mmetsp:Transcript_43728/g.171106  ORF Transcript_43728/g.171106 Transcript_43728/m.171106 type:complete len:367 (+) Transcript_43728:878-1978(+)
MSMDWFYHGVPEDSAEEEYNFDHPDALDFQSIKTTMQLMLDKKPVEVPIYDYKLHKRLSRKRSLASADVVIVEGIFAFYYPEIRDLMHMKVFVDEDADTCLARRIRRDCSVRGRDIDSVLDQYEKFVKPSFDELIVPTKRFADIIVPRGRDNPVAIDLLRRHLQHKLDDSGSDSNLTVLKSNAQTELLTQALRPSVNGLNWEEVILRTRRLASLAFEEALGLATSSDKRATSGILAIPLSRSSTALVAALAPIAATASDRITFQAAEGIDEKNRSVANETMVLFDHSLTDSVVILPKLRGLGEAQISSNRVVIVTLQISEAVANEIFNAYPTVKIVTASVLRPGEIVDETFLNVWDDRVANQSQVH